MNERPGILQVIIVQLTPPARRVVQAVRQRQRSVLKRLASARRRLGKGIRSVGVGLLLLFGVTLSVALLLALDWLQDPHGSAARRQIEYAQQNLLLRRCLSEAPYLAAAQGRPLSVVLLSPTGDTPEAKLLGCAHLWKAQGTEDTLLWLRAHALESGSSLNVATRLLRLLAIGLLTICLIESTLRLLASAKIPVASFRAIADARAEGPSVAGAAPAAVAGKALDLTRIIGTVLVTGVTGFSVLVPEVRSQLAGDDDRRKQGQPAVIGDGHSAGPGAVNHPWLVVVDTLPAAAPGEHLEDQLKDVLQRLARHDATTSASERELKAVRQALRSLGTQLAQSEESVRREIVARKNDVVVAVERGDAATAASVRAVDMATRETLQAAANAARFSEMANSRAAGMLDYSAHLEAGRWFFPDEAIARRCIVMRARDSVSARTVCPEDPAAPIRGGEIAGRPSQ